MSTVEDFKNAPVGATATTAGGVRAMKMLSGGEPRWIARGGSHLDVEGMEQWGYTLDSPAPTSAREALDLAWELAHEVREGQVIPAGTRYLDKPDSGLKEFTASRDFKITPGIGRATRTLEPLQDPEPDWLDAPAVIATCGCRGIELWHPRNEKDGMWVSASGEQVLWSTLRDVTPLYPKGQEA